MFAILSNFFRFSLQGLNKSAESFSAFRRTLVNAGILENADEDLSDLFFQDIIDVFLIDVRVIRKELIHPVRMLFDISVGADILLGSGCNPSEAPSPFSDGPEGSQDPLPR